MIHTTVGALHATMALRGALHEQIPMVVFTGESLGFGEEAGPDVGAQWLGALADIGGPARLVDRCVKWSYGVNAKSLLAVDDSARLPTGDGHAEGTGLRLAADGIFVRQDDQERGGGKCPDSRADGRSGGASKNSRRPSPARKIR